MNDASADVALALAFFRTPAHFSGPAFFGPPLTRRSAILFPLAAGRQPLLDDYAAQCKASAAELQAAARFFVEQLIVLPQATHYQVLGVDRDASTQSIKANHQCLMLLFHPDKAPDADGWSGDFIEKINSAYSVLRDPAARRRYDKSLYSTDCDTYVMRFQRRPVAGARAGFARSAAMGRMNTGKVKKLLPYIIWIGAAAAGLALIGASIVSNAA